MIPRIRILALDDDPTMGALFSVAFRNLPVELVSVEDEAQAAKLLEQQSFDLFLVDFQLAEKQGLEVAEDMLTRLELELPIVIVTAQAPDRLMKEYVDSGRCLGVELKPIRLKDFGTNILRHWNRVSMRTEDLSERETDPPSLKDTINRFVQTALTQAKDFRLRSDSDLMRDGLLATAAHRWAGVSGIQPMPRVEVEARMIEKLALAKEENGPGEIRDLLSVVINRLEDATLKQGFAPN